MDEWQLMVCAIALYSDGYSDRQIGEALGVDAARAADLAIAGAEAQGDGNMGRMAQGRPVWSRDSDRLNEVFPDSNGAGGR